VFSNQLKKCGCDLGLPLLGCDPVAIAPGTDLILKGPGRWDGAKCYKLSKWAGIREMSSGIWEIPSGIREIPCGILLILYGIWEMSDNKGESLKPRRGEMFMAWRSFPYSEAP
jgi:hypothetical protein